MRFPTKCVTSKIGMNTVNFCFIKTGSRRDFTRSCNGSRAIFLLTSLGLESKMLYVTPNSLDFCTSLLDYEFATREHNMFYVISKLKVKSKI